MVKLAIVCFAKKLKKWASNTMGPKKKLSITTKIPNMIQCRFEKETAQYMEPKNTPEINETPI